MVVPIEVLFWSFSCSFTVCWLFLVAYLQKSLILSVDRAFKVYKIPCTYCSWKTRLPLWGCRTPSWHQCLTSLLLQGSWKQSLFRIPIQYGVLLFSQWTNISPSPQSVAVSTQGFGAWLQKKGDMVGDHMTKWLLCFLHLDNTLQKRPSFSTSANFCSSLQTLLMDSVFAPQTCIGWWAWPGDQAGASSSHLASGRFSVKLIFYKDASHLISCSCYHATGIPQASFSNLNFSKSKNVPRQHQDSWAICCISSKVLLLLAHWLSGCWSQITSEPYFLSMSSHSILSWTHIVSITEM